MKVTYVEYDGMIHGFYWMQAVVDRTRDLHAEIAREVARGPELDHASGRDATWSGVRRGREPPLRCDVSGRDVPNGHGITAGPVILLA